jgi:hypothetical protein
MSGQALRCAYCGEPLALAPRGVNAWRVGNDFVCNEFCADGIAPQFIATPEKQLPPPVKVQDR